MTGINRAVYLHAVLWHYINGTHDSRSNLQNFIQTEISGDISLT